MYPPQVFEQSLFLFRQAYGNALLKLAEAHPRVVALDADMKNSTFSQLVRKKFPERHVECFICEQNMAGVSASLFDIIRRSFKLFVFHLRRWQVKCDCQGQKGLMK